MSRKHSILLPILILLIGASCTQYKDLTYLRGLGQNISDSLIKTTYNIYKVQPFDILYIRVTSVIDEKATEMFNSTSSEGNAYYYSNSVSSSYLTGFPINEQGNIKFPIIGEINVAGLTQAEIEKILREKVQQYVSDAEVTVRLLSFKITLLGEIGSGQHTIYADRANLLEVLAMGGDIQRTGNKHKILILRTTPQGMRSYRVDMTNKDIITSPLFYVQPNDVIYVEPTRAAALRISLSELSLFISTITAVTSVYFLIKTLK
jgi:polysaccharide export outer membrane protein